MFSVVDCLKTIQGTYFVSSYYLAKHYASDHYADYPHYFICNWAELSGHSHKNNKHLTSIYFIQLSKASICIKGKKYVLWLKWNASNWIIQQWYNIYLHAHLVIYINPVTWSYLFQGILTSEITQNLFVFTSYSL